jgi:asparagine synthetase B (glutamine-hydrolysing)
MSGVFGVIDPELDRAGCTAALQRMVDSSFNAEWHEQDLVCGPGWGLAVVSSRHRVLQRHVQSSSDGRYLLVFEGELYETCGLKEACLSPEPPGELGRGDPSPLVLAAFQELGLEALRELNGEFMLALWDRAKLELCVAGDCSGLRTIHVSHAGPRLAFAPQQKELLTLPWVSREPDLRAVRGFLQHGLAFGGRTLFRDIHALDSGSYLRFRGGQLQQRRYWRLPIGQPRRMSSHEAAEEFASLWRTVIVEQTRGPLRPGCLLSAGLDSRMILAGMVNAQVPVRSFTFGAPDCVDVQVAQKLALRAAVPHHHQVVTHGDIVTGLSSIVARTEGVFNCFDGSVHYLNSALAESVDVITDGWMLLDGTHYTPQAFLRNHLGHWDAVGWVRTFLGSEMDLVNHRLSKGGPVSLIDQSSPLGSVSFDVDAYLSEFLALAGDAARDPLWATHLFKHEVRQHRLAGHGPNLSREVVHVRCPGADKRILEFVARLPKRYRSREKPLQINIIQRFAPDLARVPWGMSRLPISGPMPLVYGSLIAGRVLDKVHQKTTARYVPTLRATDVAVDYGKCLRQEPRMHQLFHSLLVDRQAGASGFFDRKAAALLLADHLGGGASHTEMLGRMITVELWLSAQEACCSQCG